MFFQILRQLSADEFRSGEAIAGRLGISRATVHNVVRQAEASGIAIHSVRGRGYRLAQSHAWLDAEALAPSLSGLGYTLHLADQVDSTNSRLMAMGLEGADHKTVLAAEWQSGGRGRRGRTWVSPLGGSLAFSLLWRFNKTAAGLSGLSLAVGLGLARALRQLGLDEAQLKWPNDILHRGCKLAGILIELQGDVLGPSMAIIGVGVNARLPESVRAGIDQPVTDLEEALDEVVDRNALLAACLTHLNDVLARFEGEGFAALRAEWDSHHAFHDRDAAIIAGQGESWRGRVAGVDDSGALLLETDSGLRRFYSGELSLRGLA